MANNVKPRPPRKTWFENQAERKGQGFLDGWANGTDREFRFPDAKIRAIDTILRDIKDGYIDPNRDLNEKRLLNVDLLASIINVCAARKNYFARQSNAFAMLNNIDYLARVQESMYNELSKYPTDEAKRAYIATVDPQYQWLAYVAPLATSIQMLQGLVGLSAIQEYVTQKWMCDIYSKMYNDLEIAFSELFLYAKGCAEASNQTNPAAPVQNNYHLDPTIVERIRSTIDNVSRTRFQNGTSFPMDFNVLTGQIYTV